MESGPTVPKKLLKPVSGRGRAVKSVERAETRSTAAIREKYGEPWKLDATGCSVLVWDVDLDGDAVVMARLSTKDLKGGETAMAQVEDGLRILAHHGRRVRRIILATRLSGALLYEKRPDLALLEDMIGAGECGAVFFRDADRIARHTLILATLQELLEGTETDLYLAEPEGKLDWNEFSDRIMLSINGTISVVEREKTRRRTHSAIIRQYLKEGRGVGSKKPLGFRRNNNGFLEQHPDEWPWIERIHRGYYESKQECIGLDGFAEQLKGEGLDYSHEQVRKILIDRIYVDGIFTAVWKGTIYDGRVENFRDGIPQSVFDRNQVVLAASATRPTKATPLGLFALNGLLMCGKCGSPLEGRIQRQPGRRRILVYRHRSTSSRPVPDQCWGDTYEQSDLDLLVFRELRRLDQCEKLRKAYWRNAWPEEDARGLNEEFRERERELTTKLEELKATQQARHEERLRQLLSLPDERDLEAAMKVDPEEMTLMREVIRTERQLQVLPGLMSHRSRKRLDLTVSSAGLRTAFEELIDRGIAGTASDDLETGARLTQMMKGCLDRVVVHPHTEEDEVVIDVELFGPKVPEGVPPLRVVPPHRHAAFALGFASERARAAVGAKRAAVRTVKQDYSCLTVRTAWKSALIRLVTTGND
jgi:DNA invertase Pin-like site-specific DNA recombinase